MSDETTTISDESTTIEADEVGEEIEQGTEEATGIEDTGDSDQDDSETSEEETGDEEAKEDGEKPKELITVNGQEIDVSNVTPEQRVVLWQKGLAADEKFREASEHTKKAAHLVNALKNPATTFETLKAIGLTDEQIDSITEDRIINTIEYEKMTDEQKELHKYRQKEKEWKEREEAEKAQSEEAEEQQAVEQLSISFQNRAKQFYDSNTDVPPNEDNARIVVKLLAQAHKENIELTDNQIKGMMNEEISQRFQYLSSLSPDQIAKYLPPEAQKKLREWETSQAKAVKKTNTPNRASGQAKPKQKQSLDEYFREIEDQIGS